MSREKLRIHNTDLDNLVGNLRGEVGEIITSWTLLRRCHLEARRHRSDDITAELTNPALITTRILSSKLEDEIVARLAELGERKIGRLTFYFAAVKLGKLNAESEAFTGFVRARGFEEKRNLDISHKALPEKWNEHRHRHIAYPTLLRGIALASRLMKLVGREVLGPASRPLWQLMRAKRYAPMLPPSAGYMIMPYMQLSGPTRAA